MESPTEDVPKQGTATLADGRPSHSKKGVIYISRIPPYMNLQKLRSYMEQFGGVDRIYLNSEDAALYKRRRQEKGCKKMKYEDGWVEFDDKRIAKRVASSLNGQPVGGRKRHNFWREDIWNIRYLTKFQWHHLSEFAVYKRNVRQEKLKTQFSHMHKENMFYLQQVEKQKHRMRKERKAMEKGEGNAAAAGKELTEASQLGLSMDASDVKKVKGTVKKENNATSKGDKGISIGNRLDSDIHRRKCIEGTTMTGNQKRNFYEGQQRQKKSKVTKEKSHAISGTVLSNALFNELAG